MENSLEFEEFLELGMEKSLEIWIRVGKSLWKTSWSWRNGWTRSKSLMTNGTLRGKI